MGGELRPWWRVSDPDRGCPGGFQLLDAYCDVVVSGDDIVGELNGTSLTFQLQVVEEGTGFYTCRFFNTPTSSPGGDTATPPSGTLPPTDTGRPASTPDLGSWSATTVLLAAILAAVLISTLMVRADRTDSRRR